MNYFSVKNIIIVSTVLLLIGGAAYYFLFATTDTGGGSGNFISDFFPSSEDKPGATPEPTATPQAPGAGNIETPENLPLGTSEAAKLPVGTLLRLVDEPISSVIPTASGSVKYHKNIPDALGHLFEIKADGSAEEKKLSNYTVPQILKVVWSTNATKAVIFYNVGGTVRKVLADYTSSTTPKTAFFADSISDVAFSPDGKSIAFINDLGDTRNIFTATADNKNPKKIVDNNIPDLEISWPSVGNIALKTRSSYASIGYLYTVGIASGSFVKIAEGFGLDAVWNSDGSGVLISTVTGGGQMQPLKYFETKAQITKEFQVNTIAEKCVFLKTDKKTAFCGVPKSVDQSRYPDAWWQGRVSFNDNFVSLNLTDGSNTVFVPSPLDVNKPVILANDSYLIFQDKNTGALWSLKLK